MHIKDVSGKLQKSIKERFWNLIVLIKTALSGQTWYPKSDTNVSFCRVIFKHVDDYNFSFKDKIPFNSEYQVRQQLHRKPVQTLTGIQTWRLYKWSAWAEAFFSENLKWITSTK